jgi:hypothetical protein
MKHELYIFEVEARARRRELERASREWWRYQPEEPQPGRLAALGSAIRRLVAQARRRAPISSAEPILSVSEPGATAPG